MIETIVVGMPGADEDRLMRIAAAAWGRFYMLESEAGAEWLASDIYYRHERRP